jgi:CRP/FNR family transcriptional regulator
MSNNENIVPVNWEKWFPFLEEDLRQEMAQTATLMQIPAGAEVLREGQYIKVIPIVLSGLLKVLIGKEDKELLLYYIQAKESCIMTFGAGIRNETSKVYAMADEDSELLLLPIAQVNLWVKKYPSFNQLFYSQFSNRYNELVDTISQVVFDRIDARLLHYLKEKVKVTGQNPLKVSHRQIALELGSAREVISRMVKRLEGEGKLKQVGNFIELLHQ